MSVKPDAGSPNRYNSANGENTAVMSVAEDWGYQTDLEVIDAMLEVDGKFIVDAGCGDGALCRHLATRGAHVLGIEPNPEQAQINNGAAVVANVGLKQAGEAAVPVETNSVDGVIFKNSLHHMHAPDFKKIFNEVSRILKASGFLYVIEPIANGTYQHVMEPFHNETSVRFVAYNALLDHANPLFASMREVYYDIDDTYDSFDAYAARYEGSTYNKYTSDIRQPEVQRRFAECENSHGSYTLTQPMRVNYYTEIKH